ncbi:MAG: 2Fe-2S iron-sulfur cluster-binding protein [Armatimonadota bacterium]
MKGSELLMSEPKAETKAISFTLNGRTVQAAPGETVLCVARREGIEIPALCHHDAVSPYGACRLCLVEVSWGKRSKLVTSCIYTPWENEVIETDNTRVRQARRSVLELMLARCPESKVITNLAREYGVEQSRFPSPEEQPPIKDCILCGLCVRVCAEVVGQHAIGFAERGSERVISTPYGEQAEECIGCAACVFICPTQALHYEDMGGERTMTEFHTSLPLVKCPSCGKPFATDKQIAKVQQRLNIPEEVARTCPKCRGKSFRGTLEQCLTVRNAR